MVTRRLVCDRKVPPSLWPLVLTTAEIFDDATIWQFDRLEEEANHSSRLKPDEIFHLVREQDFHHSFAEKKSRKVVSADAKFGGTIRVPLLWHRWRSVRTTLEDTKGG